MLGNLFRRFFSSERDEAHPGDSKTVPYDAPDPELLTPTNFSGAHFNIADDEKFAQGLALIKEAMFDKGATLYSSDNLITWNRNYSFLRDPFFIGILGDTSHTNVEKSILWRSHILLYFAQFASSKPGDFVEIGCYSGSSADLVTRKVPFAASGKKYYLYDRFEWHEGDPHHSMPLHSDAQLFEKISARFADREYVIVIRGSVPDTFAVAFPEKIAFAQIDMNNAAAEAAALEAVLPRLASGGVVILDDYGWWVYSKQKQALDPIAERHGMQVLELPTGQGVMIKP